MVFALQNDKSVAKEFGVAPKVGTDKEKKIQRKTTRQPDSGAGPSRPTLSGGTAKPLASRLSKIRA